MNEKAHRASTAYLGNDTYGFIVSICETSSNDELSRYLTQIRQKKAAADISPENYAIYLAFEQLIAEELSHRNL
ncbi:hypothetical protein OAS86_02140 [Gammaproteobacteria bacterium]|nr:hypothetical protein [Gammaproteobacteria bacterium]